MNDQKGGDSTNTEFVAEFPGISSDATSKQENSAPPKEEDSRQKGDGQVHNEAQPKDEEPLNVPKEEQDAKVFKKQAEDNRRMVIDMLEEKFNQLQSGQLKASDLKEWFVKHPELAETANRSKRVKEQYRVFMNKPLEEVPATILPKSEENDDANRPLTIKDYQRLQEEADAKAYERKLRQEKQKTFEDFAVSRKLVDDDATRLKRNADALATANPDWEYSEAVEKAYATLYPQKSAPVTVHGKSGFLNIVGQQNEKVDATQGIQLISGKEFSGGQLP